MSLSKSTTDANNIVIDAAAHISIFRSVLNDTAVSLALDSVRDAECACSESDSIKAELFAVLAERAEMTRQPIVGNAWQNALLDVVLEGDNIFARKAEVTGTDGMGKSLLQQASSDLAALQLLFDVDIENVLNSYPSLNSFSPRGTGPVNEARLAIKQKLMECKNWAECVSALSDFFYTNGAAEFGKYRAFRWVRSSNGAKLKGVIFPDPISLSDLVEYEWQREEVRRNTQKLLAGLPTNNMLLYGDRGTGKSSTVKAMLNEFGGCRLRLVEVSKDDLLDLPEILSILRTRPEKYILFIDDLSFEETEIGYKALKAVLEGGIEARPANVVLYATSNRRNLIREKFSDRNKDSDEVHPGDTMQEKLSLSDRFGLKLPFLAPDQEEYLRIVISLASRAGIDMDEELRKKALTWQHARSGRSARQFVDYIIGERGLAEK